ncbi:hypothetical protein ACHAW6_005074 [Cyclotella cf. meneghiniana]
MSVSSIDKELEDKISAAVLKLVELKINFLAIDFDQTMINIHTGGRWKGTVAELVEHMRPLFLHLIPIASRHNIRVAVVTFSCQTDRIREVLEMSFPELAELIPIRGCDKTWRYEGSGMRMGKQQHIASVVEELMAKPAFGVVDIGKVTTLLIDDDPRNIRICLKDGVRAVWFNPLEPDRLPDNILLLK